MKAILIARVSTEEQKEAGNSLPAQVVRLEKYCQNKNFQIVRTFSFDESAYKNQREEFDRILDFVIEQKDKVAVCCDKVDRLSRNIFDKRIAVLYEKALNDEIELHFVSDGQIINSRISAVEKFQFGMSLGLAKYFSDAISDNVKRANEQKLRKGEWTGKAPYGYKNITRDDGSKEIIVDDQAAFIVKEAFKLYASGAYSVDLICKKLKQDHGIAWRTNSLAKLFNNPFYYGQMRIKNTLYQHRYPPIISQDLFEEVQKVKSGFNKKRHKYAGALPYLYRGLIRCAQCGLSITPEKHKGHTYYHCTEYSGKHGAKWIREEKITEVLGNVFKRLQLPADILQQVQGTLAEVHHNKMAFQTKQFDELTKEQKNITLMIDNLYLDKLKGKISEDRYDSFYTSLCKQMDEINARIARLQAADKDYFITAKYILEISSRAYDIFMGSEAEGKRHLIKLVLSNLMIDDGNIIYDAHKPFDLILNCSDDLLWRPQGDLNSCFRRERAMS